MFTKNTKLYLALITLLKIRRWGRVDYTRSNRVVCIHALRIQFHIGGGGVSNDRKLSPSFTTDSVLSWCGVSWYYMT